MTNAEQLNTIRDIAGDDAYSAILDALSGERVYFPNDTLHPDKEARDAAIRSDHANGVTYDQLVERYNVGRSTVHRVLKR